MSLTLFLRAKKFQLELAGVHLWSFCLVQVGPGTTITGARDQYQFLTSAKPVPLGPPVALVLLYSPATLSWPHDHGDCPVRGDVNHHAKHAGKEWKG